MLRLLGGTEGTFVQCPLAKSRLGVVDSVLLNACGNALKLSGSILAQLLLNLRKATLPCVLQLELQAVLWRFRPGTIAVTFGESFLCELEILAGLLNFEVVRGPEFAQTVTVFTAGLLKYGIEDRLCSLVSVGLGGLRWGVIRGLCGRRVGRGLGQVVSIRGRLLLQHNADGRDA